MSLAAAWRRAGHAIAGWLGAVKRRMYRDGHPTRFMRWLNRLDALLYAGGLVRHGHTAVLRVRGRHSGKTVDVPVAITPIAGAEYLVSMLGPGANWVRNVEATGGHVALVRQGHEASAHLELVPVRERAPVLRRYATIAPGARPHLGLRPDASIAAFDRIAASHPVYRIEGAASRTVDAPNRAARSL
jgi:hypothetical protein